MSKYILGKIIERVQFGQTPKEFIVQKTPCYESEKVICHAEFVPWGTSLNTGKRVYGGNIVRKLEMTERTCLVDK